MSGKHLGEVERGHIKVDVRLLTRLANLFGVDVGELFSGPANDSTGAPILVAISQRDFDRVDKALQFLQRLRRTRPRRRSK
jgi:transcriptional regulator with XRE-family HTH domain